MSNKHHFKDSSSITHIDYIEPDTLEVCFTSGGTYHHEGFPKPMFEAFKKAQSPGSYYHKQIRNRFKAVKV